MLSHASALWAQTLSLHPSTSSQKPSLEVTADNLEYDRERELYIATGNVVVVQGSVRLTADRVTLDKLSGDVVATGHVHLHNDRTDVWAERLSLNVNTETGMILNGQLYLRERRSLITGRRIKRFSETHYRVQDGSFTNCDAMGGEVPAWRFTFEDLDFDWDDSLYGKGVWFNIHDTPVLPLPAFRYPLGAQRKTGFLIPTIGLDNVFGFQYQQGFFWAIDPSQDLTISPLVLSKRGAGGDLEYRYVLSRQSRGEWLLSSLYDTDRDRGRAQLKGAHVHRFTEDLSAKLQVNLTTDRTLLNDLSNSGVLRALPSQESNFLVMQRFDHGSLYLQGQYLQPLGSGGKTTFQRLPELGHRLVGYGIPGTPLVVGVDSTATYFFREEGFHVGRLDLLPSLTAEGLHLGHIVGLRPQAKFRNVAYTRGATSTEVQNRATFWVGMEAFTSLSRRFRLDYGSSLRHFVEPRVIYEFVPPTDESDLVQIDAIDNLIKKSLITYSLRTRLIEQDARGATSTWLDLLLAQSYHVGDPPGAANLFSDIWTRGTVTQPLGWSQSWLSSLALTVDAFYNPTDRELTQFNSDVRLQSGNRWYMSIGQRFAQAGPQVRRGDIWNPISFNEVLSPQDKIVFVTGSAAVRLPWGVTLGSRVYHDFRTGQTSEWDVVGLYQNPCRCFSFGLYYIQFPDRQQYNFLISLTGLWGTGGTGAELMKSILSPVLAGERGLPWAM